MKRPLASVVMPVYNAERFLAEALESVLSQTFEAFEFLVVDDASTDRSREIVRSYADRDARIKLITNSRNFGISYSLNLAIKEAKGEIVFRQDADDISAPQRFELQRSALLADDEVALVSCDLEYVDEEGERISEYLPSADQRVACALMKIFNFIAGHGQSAFRRRHWDEIGGYSEAERVAQDYEFWSRLLKKGKLLVIDKVLYSQRRHCNAVSALRRREQRETVARVSLSGLFDPGEIASYLEAHLQLQEMIDGESLPPVPGRIGTLWSLRGLMRAYYDRCLKEEWLPKGEASRLRLRFGEWYSSHLYNFRWKEHLVEAVVGYLLMLEWSRQEVLLPLRKAGLLKRI